MPPCLHSGFPAVISAGTWSWRVGAGLYASTDLSDLFGKGCLWSVPGLMSRPALVFLVLGFRVAQNRLFTSGTQSVWEWLSFPPLFFSHRCVVHVLISQPKADWVVSHAKFTCEGRSFRETNMELHLPPPRLCLSPADTSAPFLIFFNKSVFM